MFQLFAHVISAFLLLWHWNIAAAAAFAAGIKFLSY